MRSVLAGIGAVLATAVGLVTWFRLSAWPGSMLIRAAFDHGARKASAKLERHLPAKGRVVTGLRFGSGEDGGYLDLYYPEAPGAATAGLPAVVWVHGGGWLSGSCADIGNYLRVLASRGVVAVAVEYTVAPGGRYPLPVRQVNRALGFLEGRAGELGIDSSRIVLAGDSAGAQIAAQVALIDRQPEYAEMTGIQPGLARNRVRATLLSCGAYDLDLAFGSGLQGWFLETALRAYSGSRNFREDETFRLASVHSHADSRFPPTFITAGNRDPLLPHSKRFAERLERLGVPVDELFFPESLSPPLGHEYQFDLDRREGREALDRMIRFAALHG